MEELTLQDLFGSGAIQDNQYLIIQKADLLGLTPSTSNRAEQLFVALLLTAQQQFEGFLVDESGNLIVDELGDSIKYENIDLYKLGIAYWRKRYLQSSVQAYLLTQFVVFILNTYNAQTN